MALAACQGKLEAEQRAELVAAGRALKERLAVLETAVETAENELQREAQKLPNPNPPAGAAAAPACV